MRAESDELHDESCAYHLHDETLSRWPNRLVGLASFSVAFAVGVATTVAATSSGASQPSPGLTPPPFQVAEYEKGVLARCQGHDAALKRTVCAMDHALVGLGADWRNYSLFATTMQPYWDAQFTYTPMRGIPESVGLRDWFQNEMGSWTNAFPWVAFNQIIFVGSGPNASTTTYAVGDWKGPLGPLSPSGKRTTVRITDFYKATPDNRIKHNYMMIDLLDLLRQQGIVPLPLSPLPQGRIHAPNGDGVPAPLARYAKIASQADEARQVVSAMLDAEWVGTSTALDLWAEDLVWYGPVPFGMAVGRQQYREHFLSKFHQALPTNRALAIEVFACEGEYCAVRGTFSGAHEGEWLGLAPSGLMLRLDVGMHWRVVGGRIVEAWAIFDLPKMVIPLGVDLLAAGHGGAELAATVSRDHATNAAAIGTAGWQPTSTIASLATENNECSNAFTRPPGGSTGAARSVGGSDASDFDCPAFVIKSTDETWHPRSWEATNRAVDTYFSEDWQSVRAFGLMLRGREALRSFMRDWLHGFPDVFIHVADVFCLGNEMAGYKTTMPYVLTATHTGWSKAFGPPTGRAVKYHGIANCYIKKEPLTGQWQYTREWDLPDMWAFLTALNLSAAYVPQHPTGDLVPVDTCKPLFEWGTGEMNWFPTVHGDA